MGEHGTATTSFTNVISAVNRCSKAKGRTASETWALSYDWKLGSHRVLVRGDQQRIWAYHDGVDLGGPGTGQDRPRLRIYR